MKINIRTIDPEINTTIPSYQKIGDVGLDLVATSISFSEMFVEYGTNLAIEIPEGFGGFLFPRSSISNYDLSLCNSIGVIDNNYRGELKFRFRITADSNKLYRIGDRIGQLIIMHVPKIELQLVDLLNNTVRGNKGFGSSGV